MYPSTLRRSGRALLISANRDAAQAPQPGQACARRLGLDPRCLPGGADRDVRDVRRAAAAPQDRHREWRPERGLLTALPRNTRRNCRRTACPSRCARRRARWRTCDCWGRKARAWRSPSFRAAWPAPRRSQRFYALGSLYREPLVGLLPRRQAARAPQSARGQAHRCRSAGQRNPRHRHAVAGRQRPDRIRILQGKSAGRAGPGRRRCRRQGLAEGRAGCRVLRRRLRGRLHPEPPERSAV